MTGVGSAVTTGAMTVARAASGSVARTGGVSASR